MSAEELIWMLAPAAGTGVGGLVVLALGRTSDRALDVLLGLTTGVMLAAASFSGAPTRRSAGCCAATAPA